MSHVDLKSEDIPNVAAGDIRPRDSGSRVAVKPRVRIVPVLITLAIVVVASLLGWRMWQEYMVAPWTRDGRVRAYTVTMAPEVAGRIVELPVADNQFVHKGDLLMVIDPTDYLITVRLAQAAVEQAKADWENKQREARRREELGTLSTSIEEKQTFATSAVAAEATYHQAGENLRRAQVNLERTHIYAPVNGYVTNLLAQLGDYATVGQLNISLVNSDSFWVDGYFEETNLGAIHDGDPASIRLMAYPQVIRGHVQGVARGIEVANAQPDQSGLANVNPIFTWVRLAQRVPVRIHIDQVPEGVRLVAGLTATVQIEPAPEPPVPSRQ